MTWLIRLIFYYLIGYVLLGGILVRWFDILTWQHMTGWLLGLLVGHYLGRSDRMPANG